MQLLKLQLNSHLIYISQLQEISKKVLRKEIKAERNLKKCSN